MAWQTRVRAVRWLVLASLVIVGGATWASYMSRRAQRRSAPPQPAPISADVGQQTQSFSLSKTVEDQILYTVHADQVTNFKDSGKALLHDVTIRIFGKDGSREDQITAKDCEYDPAGNSMVIPGEVEMQFNVPLGSPASASTAGTRRPVSAVSLVTSGLRFDQASGVAATDAPVRFRLEQGEGTSRGARYDPKQEILELKSDVEFLIKGNTPGTDASWVGTHVVAGNLYFARDGGTIELGDSVRIEQGARQMESTRAEIVLGTDYQVQQARLEGKVRLREAAPGYSGEARAEQGEIQFNPRGKVVGLHLAQSVEWKTQSLPGGQSREGTAQRVAMSFDDASGLLTRVNAEGQVRMVLRSAGSTQILTGQQAEMTMLPDGKTMESAQTYSSASLQLLPGQAGADRRTVTADRFDMRFGRAGALSAFSAQGSVRVLTEDTGAVSRQRVTTSDFLEASFAPDSRDLERVRQWGHFRYQEADRQAQAEQGDYTIANGNIVLSGNPVAWNPQTRVAATRMEVATESGALNAEGNVSSTFYSTPSVGSTPDEPIQVVADRLQYFRADDRAEYTGHARLWQGEDFLLEANQIQWLQEKEELRAQGRIYSVFGDVPMPGNARAETGALRSTPSYYVIRADSLLYGEGERRAHYSGNVRLEDAARVMTSGELDLFFKPSSRGTPASLAKSAGSLQEAVASSGVRITDGSRTATGDRAEYLPAQGQVFLYGNLATVTDPSQGITRGSKLTYLLGGDSIRVEGEPGSRTETRWSAPP